MSEQKIAYEKHPVSEKRKAELRSQGFKILDERFKPADYKEPTKPQPAQKPKTDVKD